jgi:protein DGCR14
MPPPPPPKKMKRPSKVIDEDRYTSALSHIIARDFFPGLAETDSTQEYLDALESQDKEWIAQAGQRLTLMMTPGPDGRRARGKRGTSITPLAGDGSDTPRGWVGDTPRTVAGPETGEPEGTKEPEVDLSMSLSAFQAKYTSEDNESFNKLLDKATEEKRKQNAWLWNGNKIPGAAQIAEQIKERRLLEATKSPSASNDLILAERARDKRSAMPDYKKGDPKNNFMFNPDSLEDYQQTTMQSSEAKSLAPPKAINHAGTRILTETPNAPPMPPSPSITAVDAAIAGRPRYSETEVGYSGAETPRVAGYAFVDAEVQPHEEVYMERKACNGAVDNNNQEDTVLKLLGPIDSRPNPFKISETSHRERLHHKLVDKANKNRRPQGDRVGALVEEETPGRTPTPKFMSANGVKKAPGNLTPAAQSLLRKIGTPVRKGSAWDESKTREKSKLAGVTPRVNR